MTDEDIWDMMMENDMIANEADVLRAEATVKDHRARFLIINQERSDHGDACVWWMPNFTGYTANIEKAGRYTYEEAAHIVREYPGEEFMVAESDLDSFRVYRVMDLDDDNRVIAERLSQQYTNLARLTAKAAAFDWIASQNNIEWDNDIHTLLITSPNNELTSFAAPTLIEAVRKAMKND